MLIGYKQTHTIIIISLCAFYSASAYLAMQSAVLAIVNPSVCLSVRPSVCPSHPGTVSKRLKLRSWSLHWRMAPWL